jgi:hypothetical protein
VKYLLEDNYERCKYSRPGRTIFIREHTRHLQVLPQHSILPNKNNKNSVYLSLKVNGIDSDHDNKVFVPLIPGYRVYTKLGETYFRFDIEWCNSKNTILYRWNDFGNDFTFTNIIQWREECDSLTNLRSYYTMAKVLLWIKKRQKLCQ